MDSLTVELSWNAMRYPNMQATEYPIAIGYNNDASDDLADEINAWLASNETNAASFLEKSRKFIDGSLAHVNLLDIACLRRCCAKKLERIGHEQEAAAIRIADLLAA
jgi:hypothetical protein